MLNRLDSAVPQGTQVVIVQSGYNDLRRGSRAAAIAAMDAILSRLKARQVLTAGHQIVATRLLPVVQKLVAPPRRRPG